MVCLVLYIFLSTSVVFFVLKMLFLRSLGWNFHFLFLQSNASGFQVGYFVDILRHCWYVDAYIRLLVCFPLSPVLKDLSFSLSSLSFGSILYFYLFITCHSRHLVF